jgi:hypothetical protein
VAPIHRQWPTIYEGWSTRNDNKPAVRVSKRSWRIKHGNLLQGFKCSTLAKAWTVWGFLVY